MASHPLTARKCQKSEVYQTQGPICEATCANLEHQTNGAIACGSCQKNMAGCFCPTGQVRDERGRCVDPTSCWNYNSQTASPNVIYTYDSVRNSGDDDVVTVIEDSSSNDEIPDDDEERSFVDESRTFIGDEKPIYHRKILVNVEGNEEKPVVDAFKKEEEEPETTVKIPLDTEKVVVIEEMSIPVVTIHENP